PDVPATVLPPMKWTISRMGASLGRSARVEEPLFPVSDSAACAAREAGGVTTINQGLSEMEPPFSSKKAQTSSTKRCHAGSCARMTLLRLSSATNRASDGRFRRRQRRGREPEYHCTRCRHLAAAVADHTTARVRAAPDSNYTTTTLLTTECIRVIRFASSLIEGRLRRRS